MVVIKIQLLSLLYIQSFFDQDELQYFEFSETG